MTSPDAYARLVKARDSLRDAAARAQGQLDALFKQLEALGCDGEKDAAAKAKELRAERAAIQKECEALAQDFEKTFGRKIDEIQA